MFVGLSVCPPACRRKTETTHTKLTYFCACYLAVAQAVLQYVVLLVLWMTSRIPVMAIVAQATPIGWKLTVTVAHQVAELTWRGV